MILALAMSCVPETGDAPVAATSTPWEYEESTGGEPENSAEDVEKVLPEALAALAAVNGHPVFEAYADAMVGEDDDCPTYVQREPTENWFQVDGCVSDEGVMFVGAAYTDAASHESGVPSGTFLYLQAYVEHPDGRAFDANGTAWHMTESDDKIVFSNWVILEGNFTWNGTDQGDTWLSAGMDPSLRVETTWDTRTFERTFAANGGWEHGDGDFGVVAFIDVGAGADADGVCTVEPHGTLGLQDAGGDWLEVRFDDGGDTATSTCDACGDVTWRDRTLGRVCADFATLLDWEDRPW